jgi:hypothetical protein
MAIMISAILVVAGAILFWGADGTVGGIDVNTLAVILMAGGGVGFVASIVLAARPTSAPGRKGGPGRDSVMAAAEEWSDAEARHAEGEPQRPPIR